MGNCRRFRKSPNWLKHTHISLKFSPLLFLFCLSLPFPFSFSFILFFVFSPMFSFPILLGFLNTQDLWSEKVTFSNNALLVRFRVSSQIVTYTTGWKEREPGTANYNGDNSNTLQFTWDAELNWIVMILFGNSKHSYDF